MEAGAPALGSLQPQVPSPAETPTPPAPSPALSVKSIASRFNVEPSRLSRPPSASPPRVTASPSASSTASSREDDPFGRQRDEDQREGAAAGSDESGEGYSSSGEEDEGEGGSYSRSPEQVRTLPPRPAVPPRPPAILELPPTPSVSGAVPPLPTRSSTASSTQSSPAGTFVLSPSLAPTHRARSPSEPPSLAHHFPPPPPPRRDSALGPAVSPPPGKPPALPARLATVPPVALPPRPSAAPVAASPSAPPPAKAYVPPPPPMRSVPAGDRPAPQRPNIIPSGDASSEDEDDAAASALQEFPDATFANRRPPTLRNRRPIVASQFSAWAVRGSRVVTAHHRLHIWRTSASGVTSESFPIAGDQQKFLAVEFRPADADSPEDDGRYVWCGTKDGTLYEVDVDNLVVTATRGNVHAHPVCSILRTGRAMLTLDEGGKCVLWGDGAGDRAPQLASTTESRQQRVPDKQTFAALVGDELWTSSGPTTKAGSTAVAMRSPQVRVFDPSCSRGAGAFSLLARPLVTPESAGHIGAVTASAIVPALEHLVYLAHDNGFVSVWDRSTYACVVVQRVSPYAVSALVGVRRFLWAGFRTGYICVYDVASEPWVVVKAWKAHKDPVIRLTVDPASLWKVRLALAPPPSPPPRARPDLPLPLPRSQDETLQVASATGDNVCLWDGFLREDWIGASDPLFPSAVPHFVTDASLPADAELHLRQPDFCSFRSVRALCISWNIDASRPGDLHGTVDNLEFLRNALTSVDSPDIISIGFQEVIDLEDKKLTASASLLSLSSSSALGVPRLTFDRPLVAESMLMGKKKALDGKMSDSISSGYRQWHDKLVQAVRLNMPPESPYTVVHVADMIGVRPASLHLSIILVRAR